jgi:hypothetical protein
MPPKKAEAQRRERQDPNIALKELLEQNDLSDEETLDQLRVLIDEGAKVDVPFRYDCPLAIFIKQGKILCINELILQEVDHDDGDHSMISICLNSGLPQKTMVKIIHQLSIAGADINAGFPTPIVLACRSGLNLVVKELLRFKNKPDLECGDIEYVSCLAVAVAKNNLEIVEMLIKAGANLEAKYEENGMTPLLIAAQHGNTEMVKLLIDAGANIKAEAKDDWNALHFAAKLGHLPLCQLLIDQAGDNFEFLAGSDAVEFQLIQWPCDIAIRCGHLEVVKLLFEQDCGRSMVSWNVVFAHGVEMTKAVLEYSDFTTLTRSDLFMASTINDKSVLRYLSSLPKEKFFIRSDALEELISLTKDLETKALLQKIYNKINNIPEIKKEENQEQETATKKKGNRKSKK